MFALESCIFYLRGEIFLLILGIDPGIAITGYGGPEGGEDGTPAGTVWFAWHIKGQTYTAVMHFAGDCETVLALAVRFALVQLLQLLL